MLREQQRGQRGCPSQRYVLGLLALCVLLLSPGIAFMLKKELPAMCTRAHCISKALQMLLTGRSLDKQLSLLY